MKTEIRTFKVSCDRCKKTATVHTDWYSPPLPKGWGYAKLYDCGMTGYTRTEDLCPTCLKKENKSKANDK